MTRPVRVTGPGVSRARACHGPGRVTDQGVSRARACQGKEKEKGKGKEKEIKIGAIKKEKDGAILNGVKEKAGITATEHTCWSP